ncbi:hypothetical protein D3C83_126210 [compost metagenome]
MSIVSIRRASTSSRPARSAFDSSLSSRTSVSIRSTPRKWIKGGRSETNKAASCESKMK